ncbi:PREDICTED: cationic amino acid transporter 4-like [Branchiostoma belcheri]|uniref:Cationic amino acid transporter 4-like n=1 Tax=Branchiostoma belcheri TaxID=7741 RepID=A0A6P5AIA1_BRABE|nr:PREDICTED: cationic amino acid transporter 4-like [Branchiostoma belcheri]
MADETIAPRRGSAPRGVSLMCSTLCTKLIRTKSLGLDALSTPLKRCLSTLELTLLSIGAMIGAGLYVLTGTVAHEMCGPAVTVSFLIAGIASLFSALSYAEFGARIPRAGSAYVYTYVTVGELFAFVVGWDLVLEYMIGAASVARAWSGYIDYLVDNRISNWTDQHLLITDLRPFADKPDLIAFGVVLVIMLLVILGAKESSTLNSVLTVVNLMVILFILVSGLMLSDLHNWTDYGGFMPFGWRGIMNGAASAFFGYVGFDVVGNLAEEARDPARSIPVAICISVILTIVAYVGVSAVLTLMVPWTAVNPRSALASAFSLRGWGWAGSIVAVGAMCAMTAALLASLFALPRSVYALASDGLFYHPFSKVSARTHVPVLATVVFGFLTALIALLFNIQSLVEFLSIGTLLAYTIVAASVIVTRYQSHFPHELAGLDLIPPWFEQGEEQLREEAVRRRREQPGVLKQAYTFLPLLRGAEPGQAVSTAVLIMAIFEVGLAMLVMYGFNATTYRQIWAGVGVVAFTVGLVLTLVVISLHKQNRNIMTFKVPFVPVLPAISMFLNICLMVSLRSITWIRFAVWMVIGLLVYFSYGVRNSRASLPGSEQQSDYVIMPKRKEGIRRAELVPVMRRRDSKNGEKQTEESEKLIQAEDWEIIAFREKSRGPPHTEMTSPAVDIEEDGATDDGKKSDDNLTDTEEQKGESKEADSKEKKMT